MTTRQDPYTYLNYVSLVIEEAKFVSRPRRSSQENQFRGPRGELQTNASRSLCGPQLQAPEIWLVQNELDAGLWQRHVGKILLRWANSPFRDAIIFINYNT